MTKIINLGNSSVLPRQYPLFCKCKFVGIFRHYFLGVLRHFSVFSCVCRRFLVIRCFSVLGSRDPLVTVAAFDYIWYVTSISCFSHNISKGCIYLGHYTQAMFRTGVILQSPCCLPVGLSAFPSICLSVHLSASRNFVRIITLKELTLYQVTKFQTGPNSKHLQTTNSRLLK